MKIKNSLFLSVLVTAVLLIQFIPAEANSTNQQPLVILLSYDGPVTPVLVHYIERGITYAENNKASLIVLELNTPGGSIDIMNQVIQTIRNSPVPIVVYVHPPGAMAASAGTMITLSGHVAAMAPQTTIGAASPVGSQGEDIGDTLESKIKELLKATVRTLTENRPSPAQELAEATIESAEAVTVEEALEIGLIDIKADNLSDLMEQLNGYLLEFDGEIIELDTENILLIPLEMAFIETVLKYLIDPNIVFILMTIGVQGILIELSNPGGWIAGVTGVICLVLSGYGIGILPVNWMGGIILLISFILFIIELQSPSNGILTTAAVSTFIIGALVLFNTNRQVGLPGVSVWLVIGTGLFLGISMGTIMAIAIRAQKTPVRMGLVTLPGEIGFVKSGFINNKGTVIVDGELWQAENLEDGDLSIGDRVEVLETNGFKLKIRPVKSEQPLNTP
jgi:membrane-bound serine protease (ClpP class)